MAGAKRNVCHWPVGRHACVIAMIDEKKKRKFEVIQKGKECTTLPSTSVMQVGISKLTLKLFFISANIMLFLAENT